MVKNRSLIYGLLSGLGLLILYLVVVGTLQGLEFAFLNLRELWYLIFPLAIGFGIQIGLYTSIKHNALINTEVAASGGISGGSMIACCSHFLLNVLPIAGTSGLATILTGYQKEFLGIGIIANIFGIFMLLNHKKKMKGGKC